MSTRRQISIILFCLFANFATAQPSPKTVKEAVREGLDSIAKAHGYQLDEVNIVIDSTIRRYIDERISSDPKAILYIHYWQQYGDHREGRMKVSGAILSLDPPKSSESFSFVTDPTDQRIMEMMQKITKYELPKEEGFWDSVLQPTLVTLGAIAIIALFFLIRS